MKKLIKKVAVLFGSGSGPPAPDHLFLDTFQGAENTDIVDHTPDINAGHPWVNTYGYSQLNDSNEVVLTTEGTAPFGQVISPTIDCGYSDGTLTASIKVLWGTPYSGVVFRAADATNYWTIGFNYAEAGGQLVIYEVIAGSVVKRDGVVCTPPMAGGDPYSLTVTMNGTSISGTMNGSTVNYTSSTGQTETKIGLVTSANASASCNLLQMD